MTEAVLKFLTHFRVEGGEFRTPIPRETPYEQMVREYEAGVPSLVKTLKYFVSEESTEAQELRQWKKRAKEERAALRGKVVVRHALVPIERSNQPPGRMPAAQISEDFAAFYACVESAQIFTPRNNPDGGLIFYSVAEMPSELEYVNEWFEDDEEEFERSESDGELEFAGAPPWLDGCVVFAGVGQAADRFLLATTGEFAGSVFVFDHDGLTLRRVASTFGMFLERLIFEPLMVASWIGIHGADAYDGAV